MFRDGGSGDAEHVGAGYAGHAGTVVPGGAGGLDVVRAQVVHVGAAVQVPAGGGVDVVAARLRARDPRAGRLAHPQGTRTYDPSPLHKCFYPYIGDILRSLFCF